MQAGPGLSGQQRRGQVQRAALPRLTIDGLRLIDGQIALVVGLDALRRRQVDGAETQGQPVQRQVGADRQPVLVAQDDAVGDQVQRPKPLARPAVDRRARQAGDDGRVPLVALDAQNAIPHQGSGRDLGHIARVACAVEGRRVQHQLQLRNAGGRVAGVQADRAIEVDRLAGRQDQPLQLGRARALVARHQAVQHGLVQGDARGQDAVRRRLGQGLAGPDVHRTRGEGQVARAIVDVLTQADRAGGDEAERAVGIEGRAVLYGDDARAAGGGRIAGELQQAVRHGQQVHIVGHQRVAHGRVKGRVALAQGRDPCAGFDQDVGVAVGDQQDLRPLQHCAFAHDDAGEAAVAEVGLVGHAGADQHLDAVRQAGRDPVRHPAQGHDPRADRIQVGRIEGQGLLGARRAVGQDLQGVVAAAVVGAGDDGERAAQAALGCIEQTLALEGEGRTITVGLGRGQGQKEGLAVLGQDRQRIIELGRRRRLEQEFAEAGLIVLGIGADHLGRGQDGLDLQGAADVGVGDRGGHAQVGRPIRQMRQVSAARRQVGPQLHPEGAVHQRVFGGQQGIDARRQTLDSGRNDDLLADARLGVTVDGRRRDRTAIGRHDGVDLVVGVAQTLEGRAQIGQRRLQHVDRTAATGNEARARRRAAARQVQHRTFIGSQRTHDGDALAVQGGLEVGAVQAPDQAVDGPAIGNDQILGAGRGQAAGQQVHFRSRDRHLAPVVLAGLQLVEAGNKLVAADAQNDRAERRTQNPALIDDVGAHGQRTIERQRRGGRRPLQLVEADDASGHQGVVGVGRAGNGVDVLARIDGCGRAGRRIDLGGGQRDVADRIDLAAGHADVAAADHVDLAVRGVFVVKLATARQADRAVDAETGPAHVDQTARDRQPARADLRHLEQGRTAVFRADQVVAVHRAGGDEPDVGGAQAGIEVCAVAHRADGPRQGQVARQLQVHRPVQQDDVRRVQGQAAEAARRDLVHPDPRLTDHIGQALVARHGVGDQLARRPAAGDAVAVLQVRRQTAVLFLAQDDAAQTAHVVGHVARAEAQLRHIGRVQSDRQQPARGAGAARMGPHVAVEEDAVLRLEADRAAVAGDRQGPLVARQRRGQIVDLGRGPRGVQNGAGTHHHIGRALAADRDLAALGDVAVTRAVGAEGAHAPTRNVDDAVLAQPQGGGRVVDDFRRLIVAPFVLFATREQRHLAAARLDTAVDPHALHRGQADRLTVVDADARALGQDQFADRAGVRHGVAIAGHPVALAEAVGRQAEAGALALDEPTIRRILAQHIRRPQLHGVLRRRAAGDVGAVGRKATHQRADVQLAADMQVAACADVVAREAGLEEVGLKVQRLGDLDRGLEHGPGGDGPPRRQDQIGLENLALGVGVGDRRNADAVRPDFGRNDRAPWQLPIAQLDIEAGRQHRPAEIHIVVDVIDLQPIRDRPFAGQGDAGELDIGRARQGLPGGDPIHRIAVVERQGLAGLQHQFFQKLQVHGRGLARSQFLAAAQHGLADGDRATSSRDRQRAASFLA